MALLHILLDSAEKYGLRICALNCDHRIRGEQSAADSAFVREYCRNNGVPLVFYEREESGVTGEESARNWRISCYKKAVKPCVLENGEKWEGADAVATAHHLDDNAETVLFNLARGAYLAGLEGITDEVVDGLRIIRPLISVTREEIDGYVAENGIPYVDDLTNFGDDYTRNKLRHNVFPALEEAVPGAAKALFRFSRLAADDEEYFAKKIRSIIKNTDGGYKIAVPEEKVIFRRAALSIVARAFGKKDYTSEHAEALYNLQFAENGKKFEFLGLTAFKENGYVAITKNAAGEDSGEEAFAAILKSGRSEKFGLCLGFAESACRGGKPLKFDLSAIPENAVIRYRREGDRFTKFGGGTKSLGDYLTDKKIPARVRGKLPLVACGNEVLIICGVEISDRVKVTERTEKFAYIATEEPLIY